MSRFGVFWLPWLTTAASGSCRLKSAAAIDAEDVPVAHHADESFSAATDKQAEQRRDQTYCEPPPLKLAQASLSCREGGPAEALLVDVAASAARTRQSEQLRQWNRQAEKRRQWSQTLRYSAAIHGDQPLA